MNNPATPAVISLIRPDQVDAAVELFCAQLQEHRIEAEPDTLRSIITEVIAGDNRHNFVLVAAIPAGRLVGVAFASAFQGLEHGGPSGWLEELYVLPEWRGRGVGSRLLDECIRLARARGWRALDLEVEADHQRVVSLYERHGFQPHSRSRFYLKLDSGLES